MFSTCFQFLSKQQRSLIVTLFVILCGTILFVSITAAAPIPDNKNETLITAQRMHADEATGAITASGKVEISRNNYVLHADKVTYDQKTGVMRAIGHVAILSPTGEVEFADQEEVTGDIRQAFAENVKILFPDNSRLTAVTAQRYAGRYLIADKGVFTACNVCQKDPAHPPLWQLRAKQIVHDNVEHNIYYHNATLDFAGVPVFYTPYMSTPDPTVDRRQGLLSISPGISPNLGKFVRVPYYFDISPDQDATISPTFSYKDGAQFAGEYRKRFNNGFVQMQGSVTHGWLISDSGVSDGYQWRGHMFDKFQYDISNIWRAGLDVNFSSDKSYLQRYRISSQDQLASRAFVEGFKGRNYAGLNSYYFEDLRPGTQPVQPLVLPEANFSAFGEPGKTWGGRWSLGGNILATSRDNANQGLIQQGPNTRRASLNTGWERQLVSSTGLLTKVSGLFRADTYWADNVINPDGSGNNFNNVTLARQFEQANAVMSYPLGRSGEDYQQLLSPIISLTAAPVVKVARTQPIEDSMDVEFDETNLFSPNRYTGSDLIEGGSRATYGLRHLLTTNSGARLDIFGGQSYDFTNNTAFPTYSGLHDKLSDYVGRVGFSPGSWLDLNYGFRFDHRDFDARQQDVLLSVGAPIFRPNARYITAYQQNTTSGLYENLREATIGFSSVFAKYWSLSGSHIQEFSPQPGPRTSNLSLSYTDECFIFGVTANHDDTNRVDISSGTSVVFHFSLRNIGSIGTDSFNSPQFATQYRKSN